MLKKEGGQEFPTPHIQYNRKAYCWQVAPRQSLFPLELYILKIRKKQKIVALKFGLQHRRKFGLKFKALQFLKCLQVNILRNIFSVFSTWYHFENNLCYQAFGVFYNSRKSISVAT